MENELVSIIMATKNAAQYLEEALESIAAQTYPNYELILIDANSSDATLEIAKRYSWVHCYQQQSVGFAHAWNEGIELAKGRLIAFLDSDDRWTQQKLLLQTDFLKQHPAILCVVGYVRFFHSTGEQLPPTYRRSLDTGMYIANMPGALLARREIFSAIGKFDVTMTIANDIDWFARLKDSVAEIGVIEQLVIEKRVHANNLSYTGTGGGAFDREILLSLRRSILRQRAAAIASPPKKNKDS